MHTKCSEALKDHRRDRRKSMGTVTSNYRTFVLLFALPCLVLLSGIGHAGAQSAGPLSVETRSREQQNTPQALYKARVDLVNVIFTVTDRSKKFVNNLTQADFEVFEDGVAQQIQYFSNFSKTGEVPLTIALIIDTSGSVKDKLQFEIDTASEFLRNVLRPNKDLALLMQFSSEIELVQDFTDNIALLEKGLDSLRAGGGTALYDAIYLAVTDKLRREAGRKVIVVLSDGDDNESKVKKEEAITASQKADVLVYGIGVKGDFRANFGVLKEFARETGGRFFVAKVKLDELQSAFREINQDLTNQYGLAYSSTNQKQDGSFRKIEVRCKRKNLLVKARTGYYAAKDEITSSR